MKTIKKFESHYENVKKFNAMCSNAKDESVENQALEALRKLKDARYAWDEKEQIVYEMYTDARERQNEYIDFEEPRWDERITQLVEAIRYCKIKYITFSSTWSSAINVAYILKQNGFEIIDFIEINAKHTDRHDNFVKIPALLFKVN